MLDERSMILGMVKTGTWCVRSHLSVEIDGISPEDDDVDKCVRSCTNHDRHRIMNDSAAVD